MLRYRTINSSYFDFINSTNKLIEIMFYNKIPKKLTKKHMIKYIYKINSLTFQSKYKIHINDFKLKSLIKMKI